MIFLAFCFTVKAINNQGHHNLRQHTKGLNESKFGLQAASVTDISKTLETLHIYTD